MSNKLAVLEQGENKPVKVEDNFWITPKTRPIHSIHPPDDDFHDDQEKEPLASPSLLPSLHDDQTLPRPAFDASAAPVLADRSFVYRRARQGGAQCVNPSLATLDVTASSLGSASQAETSTVESTRLLPDPLVRLTGPETLHSMETPESLPSPCPNTRSSLASPVFELRIPSLSFGPDLTATLPLPCSNPDDPLKCPQTDIPPLIQSPRLSHPSSTGTSSDLLDYSVPNHSSVSDHLTTSYFTPEDGLKLSSISKGRRLNGDKLVATIACMEVGDCLVIQTSAQPTP